MPTTRETVLAALHARLQPLLTVVDTLSRYVPVLDAKFSYRGEDVVATLDRVCRVTGYPKTIRADQGSEFVSWDMDLRPYQRCFVLGFSRPGKPTDNAFTLRRLKQSPGLFSDPSSPLMAGCVPNA